MLTALHTLPDIAVLVIVVGMMTAIITAAPFARMHLMRIGRNDDRQDAAFEGYKAVMGMIGVVLAFSLVQANSNLQAVDALVGKEGAALAAVDRALVRSGRPDLIGLRPALAAFGEAVVAREWPALASGNRSPEADAAYTKLSRGVRAFAPEDMRQQTIYAELLKQMDDLSEWREQVIEASDIALPKFFWITTGGLVFLALILAGATSTDVKQSVGVAAAVAALGLLLAFVIIIDKPFEGETSVSSAPIAKALDRNSRRVAEVPGVMQHHAAVLP